MENTENIEKRAKLLLSLESSYDDIKINFFEAVLEKTILSVHLLPKGSWQIFQDIEKKNASYINLMVNEKDTYEFEIQWKDLKEKAEPIIRIDITQKNYLTSNSYISQIVAVAKKDKKYVRFHNSKYYVIELLKFREGHCDMKEPINQWFAWLDGSNKQWENISIQKNEKIRKLDSLENKNLRKQNNK